ncbi:MAG: MFS transporter [Planctomycetaceae bacterium]|nr:MFS transporter [Planctomycetaceae bacterium]
MSWRHKSFDEVPALAIRGPELRTALRTVTAAWMFGTVWMVCATGSRVTLFCRALGFNNDDFGLMAGLPFIATLGHLIAAMLIERTGLTKHQFLDFAAVHRLLYALIALIPLAAMLGYMPALPARWAVWTMQAVLLVSSFLAALSVPAWWTWMGDLIPRRIRGRYFAHRSRLTQFVNIPVAIALAVLLDALTFKDRPLTMADQPLLFWTISALFVISAIMGLADILLFRRLREVLPSTAGEPADAAAPRIERRRWSCPPWLARVPRMRRAVVPAVEVGLETWNLVAGPMRDRHFRYYVTYGIIITFGATVGAQFMWLDLLETLHFSQTATDGLFMILAPVVGLIGCRGWGRLIDRWGRRPVLVVGSCLTILSTMPYFLASPNLPNPQFLIGAINAVGAWVHGLTGWGGGAWLSPNAPVSAWLIMSTSMLMGGTGWMGISLAQNSIILGFADGKGRSRYIAAHAALISIGGLAGSLIGGWVAERFKDMAPIIVGPFLWNNYHLTFALSLIARAASVAMAIRMPDPGSTGVTLMVRSVTTGLYNSVMVRLFYPLRIFGWRGPGEGGS